VFGNCRRLRSAWAPTSWKSLTRTEGVAPFGAFACQRPRWTSPVASSLSCHGEQTPLPGHALQRV
jgi:hypothetical protein